MSTYYSDPKVSRADQEIAAADLRGHIENIRITHKRAGYRTLQHYLRRTGVEVSEYKLRKIMKQFKLHIKPKRRFIRTTNSKHGFKIYPNLLKKFRPKKTNKAWVSDITYIRIENGFIYLAVILDLFSRKVIGYSISKRIDGELALNALKMAYETRGCPQKVIHHSDRGVQYLSDKYVSFLKDHGFKISCSDKGNPYDNAWAESFMKTLKVEEVYLHKYETILDVLNHVPEFIDEIYNKKRIHSSLGYLTPEEFELKKSVANNKKKT